MSTQICAATVRPTREMLPVPGQMLQAPDRNPKYWTENHHRFVTETQNTGLRIITGLFDDPSYLGHGENSRPTETRIEKGEKKNCVHKVKGWGGFLRAICTSSLKLPPRTDSNIWVLTSWSKHFSISTSSLHQQATNRWIYSKTMRTEEQKL